jgi:hypothetical protein
MAYPLLVDTVTTQSKSYIYLAWGMGSNEPSTSRRTGVAATRANRIYLEKGTGPEGPGFKPSCTKHETVIV